MILRACDWYHAPFGKLLGTPQDGKPVTQWPDRDEAFLQVAKAVRKAAERWSNTRPSTQPEPQRVGAASIGQAQQVLPVGPRSSNLRVARSFTQLDKDRFLIETFDYIARYIENSLHELQARNSGYEGVFRKIDASRFFATIYKDGQDVAKATIFMGGQMGAGIYYSQGDSYGTNSYNESLSVKADDQSLYLSSLGMSFHGNSNQKLSQEGAAELLWGIVVAPLQRGR